MATLVTDEIVCGVCAANSTFDSYCPACRRIRGDRREEARARGVEAQMAQLWELMVLAFCFAAIGFLVGLFGR